VTDDVKAKLAEARAAKAARDAAKAEKDAQSELEVLELEAKLEGTAGSRGVMFEIVETAEGPIGLVLGPAVLHTRFMASKLTPEDVHEYVFPCVVHPAKEKYLEIAARRPGIGLRCANALAVLYGAKAEATAGKF
jgi:hypothetical protein